jgi:hypothetical protein
MDLLSNVFISLLGSDKLFFLSFNHNFLTGNVLSELDCVGVKLLLLLFLLLGPIFSVGNHVLHLEDLVSLL